MFFCVCVKVNWASNSTINSSLWNLTKIFFSLPLISTKYWTNKGNTFLCTFTLSNNWRSRISIHISRSFTSLHLCAYFSIFLKILWNKISISWCLTFCSTMDFNDDLSISWDLWRCFRNHSTCSTLDFFIWLRLECVWIQSESSSKFLGNLRGVSFCIFLCLSLPAQHLP